MSPASRGIALVGFMGAGKSTVGTLVAGRRRVPFVDLDAVLEREHGPIAAQVAREGWAVFRERERALALALCDDVARVLATGGGTWLDPVARRALGESYLTVWLDAPAEALEGRVGDGRGRPAWGTDFRETLRTRLEVYALADHRVDASLPLDQVVDAIVALA